MEMTYTIDKEMLVEDIGISEDDADLLLDSAGDLYDDMVFKLDEALFLFLKNKRMVVTITP